MHSQANPFIQAPMRDFWLIAYSLIFDSKSKLEF